RRARTSGRGGRAAAHPLPAAWPPGTAGASASSPVRKPPGRVRPLPGVYQKAAVPQRGGEMRGGGPPFGSSEVPRYVFRPLLAVALVAGPALAAPSPESPASQPAASFFRSIHAARRSGPVAIDGRPDELAWNAAELAEGFTQFEPDDGAPPAAHHRFSVLWAVDSIYAATAR